MTRYQRESYVVLLAAVAVGVAAAWGVFRGV